MSTQDNEPPHSVVLNTLAWKNPTWFPPKFNCLFKKHLLGACWIPGTVFRWWRLSSEQACPVSALMKYGIHGSFHSSDTNYILTAVKAQLCSRKGDDVWCMWEVVTWMWMLEAYGMSVSQYPKRCHTTPWTENFSHVHWSSPYFMVTFSAEMSAPTH